MRKKLSRAAGVGVVSSLVLAGTAAAAMPQAGCPTGGGWALIRPMHQPQEADLNGDGLVCFRILSPGILAVDNTVRDGSPDPE